MKKSFVYLAIGLLSIVNTAAAYGDFGKTSQTFIVTSGPTPLCLALSKGDVDFAKKLINYGANINEKSFGMTPLMVAARYNVTDVVSLLISKGVDIKEKDAKGLTALDYAKLSNATGTIALLTAI